MNLSTHRHGLRLAGRILLALLVVVYLVYVLLGYFYLPGKLKTLSEETFAELIGRDIQAERFRYNPFTFTLTSETFAIADQPARTLLGWETLRVDLGFWSSLWQRHLVLDDVSLAGPEINIEQSSAGFNFDDILARLATPADAPPDPDQQSDSFAFTVRELAITRGDIHYLDNAGQVPAQAALEDVNVSFSNLYLATGDARTNPVSLLAQLPDGGSLALEGNYRLAPLLVEARLTGKHINLVTFADFLANHLKAKLNGGALDFSARLAITGPAEDTAAVNNGGAINKETKSSEAATRIAIDQGQLTLTELALDDAETNPPLLRLQALTLDGFALNLSERKLHLDNINYDGLAVHQWHRGKGELRYHSLLYRAIEQGNTPAPDKSGDTDTESPWSVTLGRFGIANSQIVITDQSVTPATDWTLSDIQGELTEVSFAQDQAASLNLAATLNQAPLTFNGQLTPVPFALQLDYQASSLALTPLSPYLHQTLLADIATGDLTTSGTFALQTQPELMLELTNDTHVNNFSLTTEDQQPLAQFSRLALEGLEINYPATRVQLTSVLLEQPALRFIRAAPGNWDTVLITEPDAAPTAEDSVTEAPGATAAANKPVIAVNKITVTDGTIDFIDQQVSPSFSSTLSDFSLTVENFSSHATQPAVIELAAVINKQASLTATGSVLQNDQNQTTALRGELKNLDLPGLSAYSGNFIGYGIASGDLDYRFDYQLDGQQITGKNNLLARRLELGDEVASEQAIEAPIKLGLALLRGLDGNINLDLNIKGDRSDPSFNLPGLIAKTFVNILIKTAASPFTLLGSLVGSDSNLGDIDFVAGSADLTATEQDKLVQLMSALQKKPELTLEIRGNADKILDKKALQQQQLARQLQDGAEAMEAGAAPLIDINLLLTTPDAVAALERSYREETGRTLASLAGDDTENTNPQKIRQQAFEQLAEQQVISEQSLEQLADNRGAAIEQALTTGGLTPERIVRKRAYSAALSGTQVSLAIDAP